MSLRVLRAATHTWRAFLTIWFIYMGLAVAVELLTNFGVLYDAQLWAAVHMDWMPYAAGAGLAITSAVSSLAQRELRRRTPPPHTRPVEGVPT